METSQSQRNLLDLSHSASAKSVEFFGLFDPVKHVHQTIAMHKHAAFQRTVSFHHYTMTQP